MSDFIAGFAPILVMWAVPLAPMLYAGIAATLDSLAKPGLRVAREPATAAEIAT